MDWITLPYPPALNSLYRYAQNRCYLSAKGKQYKSAVKGIVHAHLPSTLRVPYFDSERLYLEVAIYPPDKRKRDIDGICKVLLDALQEAWLYRDDSQIDQLVLDRRERVEHGKLEILCRVV